MDIIRTPHPATVAGEMLLALLRQAIDSRGHASLAVSGGSSPLPMFDAMAEAGMDIDWGLVAVFQVDERVAPDGDEDRNAQALLHHLVGPLDIPGDNVHLMPVADRDPEQAAADYQALLVEHLGQRAAIDALHLGLGDDGHTASLIPGSSVLEAAADVAATELYRGRRRVTMTVPLINRARHRVWLVPATDKSGQVRALMDGSTTAPAGLIARDGSTIITDLDA